jgi:hypothetical protein
MKMLSITCALALGLAAFATLPTASAADIVNAQPKPPIGGFTAAPGAGRAKAGTYCCTPNGCTPVNLLTICVGADNIRWTCDAKMQCTREPLGGDN